MIHMDILPCVFHQEENCCHCHGTGSVELPPFTTRPSRTLIAVRAFVLGRLLVCVGVACAIGFVCTVSWLTTGGEPKDFFEYSDRAVSGLLTVLMLGSAASLLVGRWLMDAEVSSSTSISQPVGEGDS